MKYCLLGEKLGHSYSCEIHSFSGLDYTLKEVESGAISRFLAENYDGFNVTIPYKKEIIKYLDEVDGEAKRIGAVNTVLNRGGKLFGYNTDIFGMEYSLKRAKISLFNKSVMILGSGGTSLTAKALCEKSGAKKVTVVSRSGDINYRNCYREKDVEVIINTTPVGTFPSVYEQSVELTNFPNLEGVFDCVYNPLKTQLVLEAEELGVKNTGGLTMLVAQALKSQEIWTGKEFSDEEFEKTYRRLLCKKANLVLIGMPSSGKTAVAKLLSEKTEKEVIDTDEIVFSNEGLTPEKLIEKYGEEYFREKEKIAVEKASLNSGIIIATGGGCVLRKENVKNLKRNGIVIYLERGVEKLSDEGRPLSKNGAISRLFEERRPIYESVCDEKISNDGKIEDTVEEILRI